MTTATAQPQKPQPTALSVAVIAWTQFDIQAALEETGWSTDAASSGEALAEYAGRSCYESWHKPNPATATNDAYIEHILQVGHYSVLEHPTATIRLRGVSRAFTHEMIRHRHFSPSQLSQRYAPAGARYTVPPLYQNDQFSLDVLQEIAERTEDAYRRLVAHWDALLLARHPDMPATARRKAAREAARSVLPNMTETRIVLTANLRAWRHFIDLRATAAADAEMRTVAVAVLRVLQVVYPAVFADYTIHQQDGYEIAAGTYSEPAT
jgi:thymidylate synthase (FAD)